MPAEPQIVVLRPGRRRASALCFLSAPGAGGGLAGPARAAERTRRTGRPARPVHGRLALADRLAHQFLHRGDRLGDLGRPAPALRRGIGDSLQFTQRGCYADVGIIGSGYSLNRSKLWPWRATGRDPLPAVDWVSSRRGSAPMRTAWTTWSGCAGRAVSPARHAGMRGLAAGRWPVSSAAAAAADVGDGGHDLRPDADAADGVVHRVLAVRHAEGRDLGAEPAAGAGDRLLPDRVGDAAPAAVGAGAAGPGPAGRAVEVDETFIGGDEPGLRGGRAKGKKVARRHRGGGQRAEGHRPVPDGGAGRRIRRLAAPVRGRQRRAGQHASSPTAGSGYSGLDGLGYAHERRSQRAARARGEDPGELLPAVHRVASLAKRWLLGTHQGAGGRGAPAELPGRVRLPLQPPALASRGLVFYRVLELAALHDPVRFRDLLAARKPHPVPAARGWGHAPSLDRPAANRPWRTGELQLQLPIPLRLSEYPLSA